MLGWTDTSTARFLELKHMIATICWLSTELWRLLCVTSWSGLTPPQNDMMCHKNLFHQHYAVTCGVFDEGSLAVPLLSLWRPNNPNLKAVWTAACCLLVGCHCALLWVAFTRQVLKLPQPAAVGNAACCGSFKLRSSSDKRLPAFVVIEVITHTGKATQRLNLSQTAGNKSSTCGRCDRHSCCQPHLMCTTQAAALLQSCTQRHALCCHSVAITTTPSTAAAAAATRLGGRSPAGRQAARGGNKPSGV